MLFAAIFVKEGVWNNFRDRFYTAGDGQGIYFGIFYGIMALATGMPKLKAFGEGRLHCSQALKIIQRVPSIPPNDEQAQRYAPRGGEIEL